MSAEKQTLGKHKARPFGPREGRALEFKQACNALPKSFFETVCALLNMDGGLIVLGVADDGTVSGVAPAAGDHAVRPPAPCASAR